MPSYPTHYPQEHNVWPLCLLFLATVSAAVYSQVRACIARAVESENAKWTVKMQQMQEDMDRVAEYHEKRLESCANSMLERVNNTHNHCLAAVEDTQKQASETVDSKLSNMLKVQKQELDEAWKYIQDMDERSNNDWKEVVQLRKDMMRKYKKVRKEIDRMQIPELQETVWRNGFFMHLLSDKVTEFIGQTVDHNALVAARIERAEQKDL